MELVAFPIQHGVIKRGKNFSESAWMDHGTSFANYIGERYREKLEEKQKDFSEDKITTEAVHCPHDDCRYPFNEYYKNGKPMTKNCPNCNKPLREISERAKQAKLYL